MSASQFDDLLGDFGDSTTTTTTTTTTKTSSNGAFDDDFDPFGPSSDAAPTSNGGDSGLLLDFSTSSDIKNGESSNGLDLQFEATSSDSANPLYNMSADTQSSNPLYDLSSGGSANPLYDLSSDGDTNQSSNPLYEFSAETTTSSSDPTNPLYDLEHAGTTDDNAQDVDLLSGTNQQTMDNDDFQQTSEAQGNDGGDLLGDFNEHAQTVDEGEEIGEIQVEEYEPVVMNGDPKDWVRDDSPVREVEAPEQQQEEEEVEEEQLDDYSERVEVTEEAQPGQPEETPAQPPIPAVEITQPASQPEQQEEDAAVAAGAEENLPDLIVREEGDDENVAAGGAEEPGDFESGDMEAASGQGEHLTAERNFGRDRREEDLENYCMDREESDLVDDQDFDSRPMSSLKPREERSRSPSRSIGPDTPEERESEEYIDTPEDTDATDEMDTLRLRADRSHAPSRSLEPEERKPEPQPEQPQEAQKEEEIIEDGRTVSKTTRTENRYSGSGFDDSQASSKQWEEERNRQNADYDRQPEQQDIVHFSEMSSVKGKFESEPTPAPRKPLDIQQEVQSAEGGVYESQPQVFEQWQNEEEEEEGVYENQPVRRDDVAREADSKKNEDLPAVGTASSIRAKFLSGASQESTPRAKREITPPAHGAGGEYVSEPRGYVEKYEGKAESGVFESQPMSNPDVVTSETQLEEVRPEHGYAKNTAARFREMSSQQYTPSAKREITPDRSGRVEFVSEPRGQVERYEGKAESGVFESEPVYNPEVVRSGEGVEEQLPERGMAKNLASKFRQFSSETSTSSSARGKREITPDRSGRVEYVSEPRGQSETYETEEYVPERGFAKNVAAKFRELESTAKSPPISPGRRKEFTPPREDDRVKQSVVLENQPEVKDDVVHSDDRLEEALPERGTAKNIAQRFRQIEAESRSPASPRAKKEFTPPPKDAGVYENQPEQFHADYNRPAESGIIENQPVIRDDVVRGDAPPRYEEELPERGAAKNLVSKWRQMESESAKAKSPGSGGRVKEFTPPREEPRIAEQRKSPRTPMSPTGHGGMDNGSVHPSELPGQYQPQNEATVFESHPQERTDVIREADTDWTAGMPKRDTAKKMLAKFKNIQAEANKPAPMPVRKDSECSESETDDTPHSDHMMENAKLKFEDPEKVGRSKSMRAAIQVEKCGACEKTVYAMERLEMNKRVYHKACFRCTQCKAVLTPKTFAINNDVIFCTTHYKQLFATKGNYDEGFGRMQHKKRWNSNPNLAAKDEEGENKQQSAAVKS